MNASLAGAICGLIIGVALERLQRRREKRIWCEGWNKGWEAHRDMKPEVQNAMSALIASRVARKSRKNPQPRRHDWTVATALSFSGELNPTRRKN